MAILAALADDGASKLPDRPKHHREYRREPPMRAARGAAEASFGRSLLLSINREAERVLTGGASASWSNLISIKIKTSHGGQLTKGHNLGVKRDREVKEM